MIWAEETQTVCRGLDWLALWTPPEVKDENEGDCLLADLQCGSWERRGPELEGD